MQSDFAKKVEAEFACGTRMRSDGAVQHALNHFPGAGKMVANLYPYGVGGYRKVGFPIHIQSDMICTFGAQGNK